ncbi:PspC domain-containing protein [Rubrivirga sp.]|uniref:PspC domain-containing protein n=1 Tax=Rubrivirga sp. TaxID=1885344 RepID=UPI003B520E13
MSTRSRRRSRSDEAEAYDDEFGLVSDDDIAAFMAEQELEEEAHEEKESGFWNLQTASGIGLIGLGALYSLQLLGLFPIGSEILYNLVQVLPIFAAVLIMLTGFGVLSWSPAARRRRKARKRAARRRRQQQRVQRKTVGRRTRRSSDDAAGQTASRAFRQAERALRTAGRAAGRATDQAFARRAEARRSGRVRLAKDRKNRKITGVAAGMANYFGLDPTVVRIGWVIAAIFSNGAAILPYLILTAVLKDEDDDALDDDDDPLLTVTDD